jgi:signal transduction histidine kinase
LTAPSNQVRLLWAVRVRWLTIVGFFVLACVAWASGIMAWLTPCGVVTAVGTVMNGVNQWAVRRGRGVLIVTAMALTGDVLLITLLVLFTGGVSSPFAMLYVVQVVATAMLVGFVPALVTTALSAVCCAAALWLLSIDRLSLLSAGLTTALARHYQAVWIGFLLYCLGLLAFLGGYIAARLRRSERDLARSNARITRALTRTRAAHADLEVTYRRLRATEAQLVHDEKMRALGQFVAGIAHELNNPIAAVTANIDHLNERLLPLHPILASQVASLTDASEGVEAASHRHARRLRAFIEELPTLLSDSIDAMRRASEIVKSLHAFSRSGTTDHFQPVDLHAMLDRTLRLIRHRVGPDVVVERRYAEVPPVECLPSQLDQVFLNLLLNAADAVGDRGAIVVSTELVAAGDGAGEALHAAVRVRDSGSGIPQHVLSHIFDPFFTTKPVGKGAGLGLSVSYGIVTRHGGTIDVDTVAGEGSTFTVCLPVTQGRVGHAELGHDDTPTVAVAT